MQAQVEASRVEAYRVKASRVDRARAQARRQHRADLADLSRWLAIPSVSGSDRHAGAVRAAADWAGDWLRRLTPQVQIVSTGHGPVVLARLPGRRPGPPVVIYGHLDVRPAGPGWHSPAFTPTRRGDRLYARGASDDKGQLMVHLAALRAWAGVGGPPRDVLVIIDGAEEIGSPGLRELLARPRLPQLLRPPSGWAGSVLVCSDTRMVAGGRPSLTRSLRGMINFDLTVRADREPVHAGRFGGLVLDPGLELAARLHRAGTALDSTALDSTAHDRTGAGGPQVRTALSVTSMRAGGPPGAIPNAAYARVDVRIPPRVDPERASRLLRILLERPMTPGGRVEVLRTSSAPGARFDLGPGVRTALDRAVRAGFGVDLVEVDSGGTIPGITALANRFGSETILIGFGPPDDGAHGPNEFLGLRDWARGVQSAVVLMAELGRQVSTREGIRGRSQPL